MYRPDEHECLFTASFYMTLCETPDIHPAVKAAIEHMLDANNPELIGTAQMNLIVQIVMAQHDDTVTAQYYATRTDVFEQMDYTQCSYLIGSVPVLRAIHHTGVPILSSKHGSGKEMINAAIIIDLPDVLAELVAADDRWLSTERAYITRMTMNQAALNCIKWLVQQGVNLRQTDTAQFFISSSERTLNAALYLLDYGLPFAEQRNAIVECALRANRLDAAMAFLHAGARLSDTPEKLVYHHFGSPTKALQALDERSPHGLILDLVTRRIKASSHSPYQLLEKTDAWLKPYFMEALAKQF